MLFCRCCYLIDQGIKNHFPWFALFNAMGILYTQYLLQVNFEESFAKQLDSKNMVL